MGLIDIDTVKELYKKQEINPSFMIYGEGWNMLRFRYGRFSKHE